MGALFETLHEGFSYWAQERPDEPAILAPDRDPLSFGRLLAEMESLASSFNRFGIGRGDAVAIVYCNPILAAIFAKLLLGDHRGIHSLL